MEATVRWTANKSVKGMQHEQEKNSIWQSEPAPVTGMTELELRHCSKSLIGLKGAPTERIVGLSRMTIERLNATKEKRMRTYGGGYF